ncbi:unnamed protein product [Ambrosiozyma monospora]|uniref:Unnamed protein product n=1 Tax=Ambrosiozyma monospora TaxID=43982 RepID=A0A9W7DGT0_AMBMO|nr:unnamed protein product [Ambrosiozyma monospora]
MAGIRKTASTDTTYFVFDLSPSMDEGPVLDDQEPTNRSPIQLAFEYSSNVGLGKIQGKKKSEHIGVVTLHDTETDNILASNEEQQNEDNEEDEEEEDGDTEGSDNEPKKKKGSSGNWDKCKIIEPYCYKMQDLIDLGRDVLKVNDTPVVKRDEADLPRALTATLANITTSNPAFLNDQQQSVPKKNVKYTIIIFSDLRNFMDWDEVDEIIYSHAKIYDVLVGFVYFEKPLGNNELGDEYFATNLEHIKGFTERIIGTMIQ